MKTPSEVKNKHINDIQSYFDNQNQYWVDVYKDDDKVQGFVSDEMRVRKTIIIDFIRANLSNKNAKILDCGCGTGEYILDIVENGYNIIGIDVSHKMLLRVKEKNQQNRELSNDRHLGSAYFLQANGEQLPFSNQVFDVILCVGVLQYLPHDHNIIKEIARVIKPEGVAIFTVPNRMKMHFVLDPYYFITYLTRYIWYKVLKKPHVNSKSVYDFSTTKHFFGKRYRYGQLNNVFNSFGLNETNTIALGFGAFTFFKKPIFPVSFSVKVSKFIAKIANGKHFSILKIFANRWIICLIKK